MDVHGTLEAEADLISDLNRIPNDMGALRNPGVLISHASFIQRQVKLC